MQRAILTAASAGLLTACAGAPAPAPPAAGFDDLERCISTLEEIAGTPVEQRVGADLSPCGGGPVDGKPEDLVRAAEWLARRRNDAVLAERKDLSAAVDRVAGAVLPLRMAATTEEYALPTSKVDGERVPFGCRYSLVAEADVLRQSCGLAQLQPHRTPPLARLEGTRTDVVSYPILLAADSSLPAARILDVALEDERGSVALAVLSGGAVVEHPVEVLARVDTKQWVGVVSLAPTDTPETLEGAIQALRRTGPGNAFSIEVGQGVTVQMLINVLDAAARAGFEVATGPKRTK